MVLHALIVKDLFTEAGFTVIPSIYAASLPSGTQVDTVTDKVVYDDASGRNFVEIRFTDKYGKPGTGWVAASIVGLPR